MTAFEAVWNRHYQGHYPIGYLMRASDAGHWLRFHSLPGSKRYADTEDECRILLARQNQLAAEVLGDGSSWLVQTCWQTPAGLIDVSAVNDPFWACREYGLSFAFQFQPDHDDEELLPWNVCAASTRWRTGDFEKLLLAIADEKAAPTLWISESTGSVFAPYDGGIDLFLPTLEAVMKLRLTHADWLSPHPMGL